MKTNYRALNDAHFKGDVHIEIKPNDAKGVTDCIVNVTNGEPNIIPYIWYVTIRKVVTDAREALEILKTPEYVNEGYSETINK